MTTALRYTYSAYGLRFESSFSLPELMSVEADEVQADVTIRYGSVPESLPSPAAHGLAWQSAPGRLLLRVKNVARYLIVESREIHVQALPGSSEADVRIFLFGSVLGALLHDRHMLVLHASVVHTDRGAVLFMGPSGAGKSTLLAAFLQRGYEMLAEDKAGVVLDDHGRPCVLPGLPFVQLTHDSSATLRYPVQEEQLRANREKFAIPVNQFFPARLPLRAAYSLGVHNQGDIHLEPLQIVERFQTLNRHTYRRKFMYRPAQRVAHFRILSAASRHCRVARVLRPSYPFLIDPLRERIEADLE